MYTYNSNGERVPVNSNNSPVMGFPSDSNPNKKKDRHRMVWIIVAILALLLLAVVVYMMMKKKNKLSHSVSGFRRNPPSFGFTFY